MIVGIVGDTERAMAWEQHLRPHQIVQEVDVCTNIEDVGKVDACLLVDDSESNLNTLLECIQKGLNCFLISKAPTDNLLLEKIHRAAKEAGVLVQFSHWPTLAPATQFMMDRISRPAAISIFREVNYTQWINTEEDFAPLWIEELGLCIKWMNSGIHHLEAKEVRLDQQLPLLMHIFLRFDNGSTSDINIYTGASENRHQRIVANKQEVLECDVRSQRVRVGRINASNHLFFDKQTFDPSQAAEKAALLFLKSIQMNRETSYSAYDAYQLSLEVERVNKRLRQFR